MRDLFILFGLGLFFATSAVSQERKIEEVISRQIEAFKVDDFATAFGFASPTIQSLFGTPENFGTMVRGGYPMVWRPAEVEFQSQVKRGDATWQRVKFVDQQGAVHWFAYEMLQVDGEWRINGVYRMEQPSPTV